MNTKQKLAYIAIGGLLVATGMIISPLNAQKDKFGEIECTKLTVVGDKGIPLIELSSLQQSGFISVEHEDKNFGRVAIGVHSYVLPQGGYVFVEGRNGENTVLGVDGDGGFVSVSTGNSCGPLAEMAIRKLSNGHLEGAFNQSSTR